MDENYFIVKKENVIDKGSITLWSYERVYSYLVFQSTSGEIYVNTDFYQNNNDEYACCKYYTRILSKNMDGYKKMTKKHFEEKVYGAWMDGAR